MASNNDEGDKEQMIKKKLRHADMIRDLKGRIPKDSDVFENVVVGLTVHDFTKAEIARCEQNGIKMVLDILEQKGDFDIGEYDVIRKLLFDIDKKAVKIIDACDKDIKIFDGIQPEDNKQDSFVKLRSLKTVYKEEGYDGTADEFYRVSERNASSMSNINGSISTLPPTLNQTPGTSYLDILPGRYSTNKEQKNFLRLSMEIVDLCSDVLRTVLYSVCQPSHLIKRIKFDDPLTSKLTNDLSNYQIEIFKEAAETKSYQYFDITLLYVLLRIIALQDVREVLETEIHPVQLYQLTMDCEALVTDVSTKLNATELKYVEDVGKSESYLHLNPTLLHKLYTHLCKNDSVQHLPTRWGGVPYKNSIKLGDDIERIHQIRNKVYGYATSTNISDAHFKIYWNDLSSIMKRMDIRFNSFYKVNLDMLTSEMAWHMEPLDLEEIKSNLRQANGTIRQLLQELKSIEEQMDRHNITAYQADHKHQLELKDRERQMELGMMDKRIELERIKNEQMERNKIADHKHRLELKDRGRQMKLEMMDKMIELERVKNEQMERNKIADHKHQLELKDRERQMKLEMMDKMIELERVKNDRLSNSCRCNETFMFLMGFFVGIVSIFTTASVLLSVNQFS